MPMVTVSPEYQVVIPREIRESMAILPGHKIQMLVCHNRCAQGLAVLLRNLLLCQ